MAHLQSGLLLLVGAVVAFAAIETPICGYNQAFDLGVKAYGSDGPQSFCFVEGVPTTTAGLSKTQVGPVTLDVPAGHGNITVNFVLFQGFSISNALVSTPRPGSVSSLIVDRRSNAVSFNSGIGSAGDTATAAYELCAGTSVICQVAVSFRLLAPTAAACTPGQPQPAFIDAGKGTVFFPAGNTIVQNNTARGADVANTIQTLQSTYGITITPTVGATYEQVSCNSCTPPASYDGTNGGQDGGGGGGGPNGGGGGGGSATPTSAGGGGGGGFDSCGGGGGGGVTPDGAAAGGGGGCADGTSGGGGGSTDSNGTRIAFNVTIPKGLAKSPGASLFG